MWLVEGETRVNFSKSVQRLAQRVNAESSAAISRVLSLFFFFPFLYFLSGVMFLERLRLPTSHTQSTKGDEESDPHFRGVNGGRR